MTVNRVPRITLNDGNEIPQLGFGVFRNSGEGIEVSRTYKHGILVYDAKMEAQA
jgi:diketogulonate reductase-like aldo/keto reductase